MRSSLQRLFTWNATKIVGVDVGTSSVKIAALSLGRGQPALKGLSVTKIPAGLIENGFCQDSQALGEVLAQAVRAAGTNFQDAVLGVGSPGLFIREVIFPPLTPEELQEAVKWDHEKYVPFAPGSYYFDYAPVGAGASELEMKVLLVAAPKEIVDGLVTAAKNAGLRPVGIDAEPLALYRTLKTAENSLVVDIGSESSQVAVFQGGVPVATRSVPIGGRRFTEIVAKGLGLDFDDAKRLIERQTGLLQGRGTADGLSPIQRQLEALIAEMAREALRTAEYYQMQNKQAVIDRAYLTGGGASLKNLAQYFAALLDIPVAVHDPVEGLAIGSAFDLQYVRDLSARLGVAIGLALRGGGS